jgi:hypothetical protein
MAKFKKKKIVAEFSERQWELAQLIKKARGSVWFVQNIKTGKTKILDPKKWEIWQE